MAEAATSEGIGLPDPANLEVGNDSGNSVDTEVSRETGIGADDGAAEGATEGDEGSEGGEGVPGAGQARNLFEELIEKDDSESAPKTEELPPEVKSGTRAAEAIVGLRQRAQRAESEHANLQRVLGQQQQQYQGWAQNLQQQNQQLREQMIQLQTQLQYAPKPNAAPKTEAQAYIDQLRADFRQEVAQQELEPLRRQLAQQSEQLQQWQQQQQQAQQAAQVRQDAERFQNESARFWRSTVLREVPQDVDVPDVGKYLVLAAQAYNPQFAADPEAAARMIRRTILESAGLIQKYAGQSARKSLEAGKTAATSIPRGAADGTTREANPNMDVLLANGFDSPMDWKEAGRPRLRPVKVA